MKSFLPALLALAFVACKPNPQENQESSMTPSEEAMETGKDPHSYAKADAQVKHLNWDANISFENKVIEALAEWEIETQTGAENIFFDIYDLEIDSVLVDGEKTAYALSSFDEHLGQGLRIPISESAKKVSIYYRTGDDARALQWLDAEQTADKGHPFLFTQSQAILARSWVPTQDSPGVRFTYEAKVKVPSDMLALMSASNPMEKSADGVYSFEMPQAIPSYLLALSVGNINFEAISDRTGVYAEPSLLEASAYEFADLEKMVQAAEELYGPYAWGRYDLIVLPPSFPFGGMENPRLTFATPTILAGDRSLVSLVAHELAHSWSGNLVTNATWDDFWLNEGFTVYFEHRIMEAVYGREYSEMLANLTRAGLQEAAADMLKEMPNDTKLKLDLEGRNPDDGVTSIPYDKGYFFLRLMEETVGRERFDEFLTNYFQGHKFQVMTTEEFLVYLKANLLSEEEYASVRVDEWIYETGIPDNLPEVESDRFAVVDEALNGFLMSGELVAEDISAAWTTHEWLHFINSIPDTVSAEQLAKLDAAYKFTASNNSEISAAWFQPTIAAAYEAVYPKVESFLISVGRRKFLTPTYKALLNADQGEMAKDIYKKARPNYHAVSRETMDNLLGWEA
ncbi:MAG: M1 family metallopeptidase [Croceimicrobium sp.]|nr:M1 family metallopeptidase [Bacteroidota bacterium]